MRNEQKGILYAFGAYGIWGLFPLYWKLLDQVNSMEILLSRVIWSFVFTTIFILLLKQKNLLIEDLKLLWSNKKIFLSLLAASFAISCNWYIYIFAVNNGHVIETSLGYYINPIITVLFGMIFFKERLSKMQLFAVLVALVGVVVLTISYGEIPWVALLLAFSFATYGALKKKITLNATRGLAIETLFILPFALIYYIYIMLTNNMSFLHVSVQTDILLILAGVVTAIPLVLFSMGAKLLPQYLIGFIQYITPTTLLIFGIVLYNETFSTIEFISFSFIWLAIIIFTISTIIEARKRHNIRHEVANVEI
ncbi:chloramphenicol-sensitive protein RarD [Ureibacillus xyleni]|uniref:Chloramphenicol-sensitive protein RarD n=1 Tax=Ureibacillus xyleni TaxID=614648 RepID=A0A285SFR0_9BACL|nr:EamA family transporter RarD [Ureibacillus xyleni]SOC06200.1 chloramphenicol-sensitive protein RarD [Ureibacillus xyleni]